MRIFRTVYTNSIYSKSRVQMASVGELQILPSRVQFPLDSVTQIYKYIYLFYFTKLTFTYLFLNIFSYVYNATKKGIKKF